jgi:RNA polymerase subunit RPABC4/transcription elongation factor Spt4
MEFKTAEPNLRDHSSLADAGREQFNEVDLYDDLLIFSDLSPEQQQAAAPSASSNPPEQTPPEQTPPEQTPVEIIERIAADEAQKPVEMMKETPIRSTLSQTGDEFFFEPPPEQMIKEAAFQMTKESSVDAVKEIAPEPAREIDCAPAQTRAFDKTDNMDSQLAEILRITGPLASLAKTVSATSVCANCGSPADEEEMFCITCGGLLDEPESEVALLCDDCGSAIERDEIFCPSCGSVMPGA